jgi:hypothetical protein
MEKSGRACPVGSEVLNSLDEASNPALAAAIGSDVAYADAPSLEAESGVVQLT